MLHAECAELREKVERRNREVRELNQMLKAWEAMRHSKDKQIAQLVERCKRFEDDSFEKQRSVDAMRARMGRERVGCGGGGSSSSPSFGNGTPGSVSGRGLSRGSPAASNSAASSFAFETARSKKPAGARGLNLLDRRPGASTSIDKENPPTPASVGSVKTIASGGGGETTPEMMGGGDGGREKTGRATGARGASDDAPSARALRALGDASAVTRAATSTLSALR